MDNNDNNKDKKSPEKENENLPQKEKNKFWNDIREETLKLVIIGNICKNFIDKKYLQAILKTGAVGLVVGAIIWFVAVNFEAIVKTVVFVGIAIAFIVGFIQSNKSNKPPKSGGNGTGRNNNVKSPEQKKLDEERKDKEYHMKCANNYETIGSILYRVLRKVHKKIGVMCPEYETNIRSVNKFPMFEERAFTIYRFCIMFDKFDENDISSSHIMNIIQGELTRGLKAGEFPIRSEKANILIGTDLLPCLLVDRVERRDEYLDIDIVIPNEFYVSFAENRASANHNSNFVNKDDSDDIFS